MAGAQVPLILFVEVVGNVRLTPAQIGAIELNVVVVVGLTVNLLDVGRAHCPSKGVNVYVVVALGLNTGDQFPLM